MKCRGLCLKATPQIDTLFKILTPMGYKLAIVPKKFRHDLIIQSIRVNLSRMFGTSEMLIFGNAKSPYKFSVNPEFFSDYLIDGSKYCMLY